MHTPLASTDASLTLRSIPSPLLVVEASTTAGSTALVIDGRVVGRADVAMGVTRDDTLFPAVQALLAEAGCDPRALRAIVCGAGPGSFTSLRIAGSLAKGLAYASECPLFSVSSLMLAAATVERPGLYVVHSDALRGERFALDVEIDVQGMAWATSVVRRLTLAELAEAAQGRVRLAVVGSPGPAIESQFVTPDAAAILRCGDWWPEGPVSLEQWEPEYGRLAEAQVKWEQTHGRTLTAG